MKYKKQNHAATKIKDKGMVPISLLEEEFKRGTIGTGRSLSESGIYFLNGDINSDSVGDVIRYILEANIDQECTWEYITLVINSPGGYVTDGFALIDVIFGSRIPIRTVGIGMIASMGLQIFLTGEKGSRTLTPNCMILSHQYTGGTWGKEHELVAAQIEQDILSEIVIRHYKRTTGLNLAEIRKYLLPPQDVWLTAKQAKKFGICDLVKDLKPKALKTTSSTKPKRTIRMTDPSVVEEEE